MGAKKRTSWVGWLAALAIVGIVIAVLLPSYADYRPHAEVANVFAYASGVRNRLAERCAQAPAERAPPGEAVSREPAPAAVAGSRITPGPQDSVVLEVRFNEIRWGAPWRWEAAIPAGATLVFEGNCVDATTFKWDVARRSSVPVRFLPLSVRERLK